MLQERYKIKNEMWEEFGESLMLFISTRDGIRESKETIRAWRIVIASMTGELRCGYERGARQWKEHCEFLMELLYLFLL
jgi:hypothetical protein